MREGTRNGVKALSAWHIVMEAAGAGAYAAMPPSPSRSQQAMRIRIRGQKTKRSAAQAQADADASVRHGVRARVKKRVHADPARGDPTARSLVPLLGLT